MNLRFSEDDWKRIEMTWKLFWAGTLGRPVVWMEHLDGQFPRRDAYHTLHAQYDRGVSAEEIAALEAERLEATSFRGDAFPKIFINFGPGSAAAYMGSALGTAHDTVWFQELGKELPDFSIRVDRQGYWYNRVMAVIRATTNRLGNMVQISFSDIGGNLDILASLRGTQNLAMDLYDMPDLVETRLASITAAWLAIYDEEYRLIASQCRGTTAWAPIWSPGKTFMLQSDFSYMISPVMFRRFVQPDLERCCTMLDHSFYHLDGPGELPHLDILCGMPALNGIQWIPGAGNPPAEEWPDVLAKIIAAGKRCQVFVTAEGAKKIVREHGGDGFIFHLIDAPNQAEEGRKILSDLGWKEY